MDTDITCVCRVISNVEKKEYVNKYIVKIENSLYSSLEKTKVILYTDKSIYLNYGDIIKINGKLENPEKQRNSGGFDYSRYLKQDKIVGIFDAERIEVLDKKIDIFSYIFKLRNYCSSILENSFDIEYSSLLKGLLLGDMSDISNEVKKNFQKSNLAHVLAISGTHFVYVIIVIDFIFEKLIALKRLRYYLEIIFLVFFTFFTGASVSCVRAGIMMILSIFSKLLYRENDFYSNLFFSFCFIIVLNVYNLENVGMWLSFLGTLALVLFERKIDRKNKVISYILNNLYLSFSVQVLIFPIIAYYFNTVSLTFFISNLLIGIFSGPVVIIGYLYLFFHKINILRNIEIILIRIILKIATVVGNIKFSSILLKKISIYFLFLYYFFILIFINREKIKAFIVNKMCKNNFSNNNLNLKKLKLLFKTVVFKVFIFIIILLICFLLIYERKCIQINFIDVGQGDCTLIILENNKTILIDGGENDNNFDYGERVLAPYLLNKGIKKIDFMIVSHFDSDHVGGLFYIVENFKVESLLIGKQFENNPNLENMLKLIRDKNINLKVLRKGDKYIFNKDIFIEVLFPIENEEIKENSINNNSLVFKLYLKDVECLFTGDIEKKTEEKLIKKYGKKLKCDILKVAHHGSNTSSINEFIKLVNPKIGLIGCGKNNKFGHPSKSVLERFKNIKCEIYRTDLNGEISIKIDGRKINIDKFID